MFGGKEVDLAIADAMFPGAGAAQRQRPHHHALVELLRFRQFSGLVRVDQECHMEVPVADMADDRRYKRRLSQIGLGFRDALCQPGDGNTDIRCPAFAARSHCLAGVVGVVPGLPEPVALLRL